MQYTDACFCSKASILRAVRPEPEVKVAEVDPANIPKKERAGASFISGAQRACQVYNAQEVLRQDMEFTKHGVSESEEEKMEAIIRSSQFPSLASESFQGDFSGKVSRALRHCVVIG